MRIDSPIDVMGMIISGLCAIHCVSLPILLLTGLAVGFSSMGPVHDKVEISIMLLSTIIVTWAMMRGFKAHGDRKPVIWALIGIALLFIGFFWINTAGHLIMALGGIFVAIGHLVNLRLISAMH